MPCAPGMLRTITVGLPGRRLAKSGAITRPDVSVPPPEELATIMVIVLSLNETASSAAAAQLASQQLDRTIQNRFIAQPSIRRPRRLGPRAISMLDAAVVIV